MTAIANFNALRSLVDDPHQYLIVSKNSAATQLAGGWTDLFAVAPFAGAAPTTAAAPTNATTGALAVRDPDVANDLWLLRAESRCSQLHGTIMVYDRLSHQGGLSGTVTGAQTTNLPTAALTRYTTGVGVMAAYEIYTAIGTTATTATISYTNQAGTSGQTSPAFAIGGASPANQNSRFFPIPLAAGDTGVRAVANINLVASTVTAGAFGITLFKPLMFLPLNQETYGAWRDGLLSANIAKVLPGACLALACSTYGASSGIIHTALTLAEA